MPITREQFEAGVDDRTETLMASIHGFLAANETEAYTFGELRDHLKAGNHTQIDSLELNEALTKLVSGGSVERRFLQSTFYYAYRGPLILVTSLGRLVS